MLDEDIPYCLMSLECLVLKMYYYHFKQWTPREVPIASFFFFLILFILTLLGLCGFVLALSSCGDQGLLFIVVNGLLIVVASLVVEHRL